MFEVGDVVRFHSQIAGKEKFHICLGRTANETIFAFLFLNSKYGYEGDCVLEDGQVPGLPRSTTGQSVVSFSLLVRMREDRLQKFGAAKTGKIDAHLAGELAAFCKTVRSLTREDKAFATAALESLFE